MAFGAFKAMMGSAGKIVGPIFSDLYGLEVVSGLVRGATIKTNRSVMCPGNSSTYYIVSEDTSQISATIATHNTNYVTTSSPNLNIIGTTSNLGTGCMASVAGVDATHIVCIYPNTTAGALNEVHGQYITNTTGTLSATVADTLLVTTGDAATTNCNGIVCVLDTNNALALALGSINTSHRMSLFHPTTLAVTQSNTSASNITAPSYSSSYDMVSLGTNRAIVSFIDGSNNIKLVTIDVVSGVSFTINAAVSLGITGSTAPAIYGISATQALIIYMKSSSVAGARILTVGAGGSITLNTEYTTTLTKTAITAAGFSRPATYGSGSYVTTYISNATTSYGDLYMVGLSVSGTTILWDSAANSLLTTSLNVTQMNQNLYNGAIVDLDSTHVAILYGSQNADGNTGAYTGVVDVTPTTSTWSTFSGNSSAAFANSATTNTYYAYPAMIWYGTNSYVVAGAIPGGLMEFYNFNSMAGASGVGVFTASTQSSGINNGNSALCNLGVGTSAGSRIMNIYASTTNTITAQIISVIGGTMTLNTSTTFGTGTSSGIGPGSNGLYNLIPLTSDTAMCLYQNQSATPFFCTGRVLTATTGGVTFSSLGTGNTLLNQASESLQGGNIFLQWDSIDSSNAVVIYATQNTGTTLYSLKMCILNVSGTTITEGTIVDVYTSYVHAPTHFGVSIIDAGKGIITYSNDAATGTTLYANGFTYSGTTITLGTQNSLATGLTSIVMPVNGNGNKVMTKVSTSEAMVYTKESTTAYLRKLTYVNNNSITTTSAVSVGTQNGTYGGGIIPSDDFNNTFSTFYTQTATSNITQWYRG